MSNHSSNSSFPLITCNQFCSENTVNSCIDTMLLACPTCNSSGIIAVGVILLLLGIVGFVGNALVIAVTGRRLHLKNVSNLDAIKLSLAIVDILLAIQIFAVNIPRFVSLYTSVGYLYYFTPKFFIGGTGCGFIMILCILGSLYHLLYFGGLRLYAVVRPFQYAEIKLSRVWIGVGVVWIVSFLTTSYPAWFPEDSILFCATSYACFVCNKGKMEENTAYYYVFVTFLLPFCLMTAISILTAVVSYNKLHSFNKQHRASLGGLAQNNSNFRRQLAVFKTIAIMQIGFTITIAPIVVNFIVGNGLSCKNTLDIELGGILLILANGVTNPVIYLIREQSFRKSVLDIFKVCKNSFRCQNCYYFRRKGSGIRAPTENTRM